MPVAMLSMPESVSSEPHAATTLVEALAWHAERQPEDSHIIFLGEAGEVRISYGQLYAQATAIAGGLQAEGLEPGQTVAIMLPTMPEYFTSYFGILLAGGVPVPIYPPARLSQLEEHVRRHAGILANAETGLLITVPEAMPVARLLEASVPVLRRVVTPAALGAGHPPLTPVPVQGSDIAFIQYTSGSTGDPKGVVLTHANLLANIRAIGEALEVSAADVTVSWLPLYHDMGLIAAWLSSLYHGIPFVVMSPLRFLTRPAEWLWAIHRYRGTLTAAPNFAYELCCQRIGDASLVGLDLSSLRFCANGAEPVSPETLERFCQRFAASGFRRSAMAPVYGLAEASVGLAVPPLEREPRIDVVERETFMRRGRAEPTHDAGHALRFVACGRPLPGHEIRIVDETGHEVGERVEGRLHFRGPSATQGYYRRPEATAQLMSGDWLDSGDRAYLAEGEVFITGRVKDIIIRGGRNIYPHEVETVVGSLPGVRSGCVAVFGSRDVANGTERLIILAESTLRESVARQALQDRIQQVVVDTLGEPPDEILLVPPHSVLKTSSGKLRRAACRELYERGEIGSASAVSRLPRLRLTLQLAGAKFRRWLRIGGELAYAVRVWLCFAGLAPITWIGIALTPTPAVAWRLAGRAARLFFRLAGIRIHVQGQEHLPATGASVLVANHASYLDGLILAAVLPRPHCFVAKRELQRHWLPRIFLERLGTRFVERFVAQDSAVDAEQLTREVGAGQALAVFPEGTFKRMPGLLPFRLGAFAAAAQTGAPIVPVALRGTRSILRGDAFFPRRGVVSIEILPVLVPQAGSKLFAEAIRLRDLCHADILRACGEFAAHGA